jgi:hypothetical protein
VDTPTQLLNRATYGTTDHLLIGQLDAWPSLAGQHDRREAGEGPADLAEAGFAKGAGH